MPDFSRAEITAETHDLTAYRTFFKRLSVGQVVTLPLEAAERSRQVMRALNIVASESHVRLFRLSSAPDAVRFRVLPGEKRRVTLSEETKRARAAKARAARARRVSPAARPAEQQGDEGNGVPAPSPAAAGAARPPRRRRAAAPRA